MKKSQLMKILERLPDKANILFNNDRVVCMYDNTIDTHYIKDNDITQEPCHKSRLACVEARLEKLEELAEKSQKAIDGLHERIAGLEIKEANNKISTEEKPTFQPPQNCNDCPHLIMLMSLPPQYGCRLNGLYGKCVRGCPHGALHSKK